VDIGPKRPCIRQTTVVWRASKSHTHSFGRFATGVSARATSRAGAPGLADQSQSIQAPVSSALRITDHIASRYDAILLAQTRIHAKIMVKGQAYLPCFTPVSLVQLPASAPATVASVRSSERSDNLPIPTLPSHLPVPYALCSPTTILSIVCDRESFSPLLRSLPVSLTSPLTLPWIRRMR
jgi:hypothetical protein